MFVVYSQPGAVTIPIAATGMTVAGGFFGMEWWVILIFAFCAGFAVIGAICAAKRTLPVPTIVRKARNKRREAKLSSRR